MKFRFSFPVLLAAVTGAALGFGVLRCMHTESASFPLRISLLGPAGPLWIALAFLLDPRMVDGATHASVPIFYALYAGALAKWPRLRTALWIFAIHAGSDIAMFATVGWSPPG